MLLLAQTALIRVGGKSFTPITTIYTSSQTVVPPDGADLADIELWGAGGAYNGAGGGVGGEGGSYAKKTISLPGVSSILLNIPGYSTGDGQAATASVSGTVVCLANGGWAGGGHNTAANVGDVTYRGGLGLKHANITWFTGQPYYPGGAAAGPLGPGGDAYVETDGSTYGYWIAGFRGYGNLGYGGDGLGGDGGALYGGANSVFDPQGRPGVGRITFR